MKEDVEQHKGGRERFLIGCRYWGLKFHIYLQKETSINCFSALALPSFLTLGNLCKHIALA